MASACIKNAIFYKNDTISLVITNTFCAIQGLVAHNEELRTKDLNNMRIMETMQDTIKHMQDKIKVLQIFLLLYIKYAPFAIICRY
jgi:hypothetical protein